MDKEEASEPSHRRRRIGTRLMRLVSRLLLGLAPHMGVEHNPRWLGSVMPGSVSQLYLGISIVIVISVIPAGIVWFRKKRITQF